MQAFILTCLLCLQTQFPCDSNIIPPSIEDPSCSQCLTDLRDHFNLTNSLDMNRVLSRNLAESSESGPGFISDELKENLGGLFADMKAIVQNMKGNPDETFGMINKMKNEMNQVLVASGPSAGKHDENLLQVPGQKGSLEKILEKFSQTVDGNNDMQRKLAIMQGAVSNKEEGEKRDSLRQGDRLMIGESLVSKNGKYRWNFELGTTDFVVYDEEEGKEVKRQSYYCFSKPIGSNINILMNHAMELYWDIWPGKNLDQACSFSVPRPCDDLNSNCYTKLDDAGDLKLFTSRGEAVVTYI